MWPAKGSMGARNTVGRPAPSMPCTSKCEKTAASKSGGVVADADSRAVVDAIASTPTGAGDRPVTPVVVESVEIERVAG